MSLEHKNTTLSAFEEQLVIFSSTAVKVGKLLLVRAALMLVGDSENIDEQASIPAQRTAAENPPEAEQAGIKMLDDCAKAFNVALERQSRSKSATYLKTTNNEAVAAEYILIKPGVFLYRPTLDAETESTHPYWLQIDTVGYDSDTKLPTLYYRTFMIDGLGSLQAQEHLSNGDPVLRQLEPTETLPIYDLLDRSVPYQITPCIETPVV